MEIKDFCIAFLTVVAFYNHITRSPFDRTFFIKPLFFLVALLPGLALLSWTISQEYTRSTPILPIEQAEHNACMFIFFSCFAYGMFCCIAVDIHQPWRPLLYEMGFLSIYTFVIFQGILMYCLKEKYPLVTVDHLSFLFRKAPSIITRYIIRLPVDGLGDVWWLCKLAMYPEIDIGNYLAY